MKFGKQLLELQVASWEEHYVNYKDLKRNIFEISSQLETLPPPKLQLLKTGFIRDLQKQLDAVDAFYGKLRNLFQDRVLELEQLVLADKSPTKAKIVQLREEVLLWREYVELNYTAARKILKKYDKRTKSSSLQSVLPTIQNRTFYSATDIDEVDQSLQKFQAMVDKAFIQGDSVVHELKGERRKAAQDRIVETMEVRSWRWYLMPFQLSRFAAFKILKFLEKRSLWEQIFVWVGILAIESLILYWYKEPLQASSFHLTEYLRQYSSPLIEEISHFLHHRVSSGNWILVSLLLVWTHLQQRKWLKLYNFLSFGFVVKSLLKTYLQSPRGFWLWTAGSGTYCGKGFSLPSGHAMVSLCFLSFLTYLTKSPFVLLLSFAFEIVVFLNVTFIGTHTYMDVIVGWTAALATLAVWLQAQKVLKNINSSLLWSVFFVGSTAGILILDYMETLSHPKLPPHYQVNMERYCGIEPGKGTSRMSLKLEYTNTPLLIGLMISYALNSRYITGDITNFGTAFTRGWKQVILCFIGGYIFLSLYGWCKELLGSIGYPSIWAPYIHNVLSPLLGVFIVPFVIHIALEFSKALVPQSVMSLFEIDEKSMRGQLLAVGVAAIAVLVYTILN